MFGCVLVCVFACVFVYVFECVFVLVCVRLLFVCVFERWCVGFLCGVGVVVCLINCVRGFVGLFFCVCECLCVCVCVFAVAPL